MTSTPITEFLLNFSSNSGSQNFSGATTQFAPAFLAAGPNGAQAVSASDFAKALPARKQHFESLGLRAMSLTSVAETTLSARYTLARTHWRVEFAEPIPGEPELVVESIFIVDTVANPFQIVLYLSCHDLGALLQARKSANRDAPPA
ncbi:MAG TPA: hypothetical protein VHB73_04375 [Alphaproteobacteria bacterium]|nr:hypothetical protein [Alphaproteobacteria bacterium]